MSRWRRAAAVVIFAGIGAILVLPSLIQRNFGSVASLRFGTDDAFVVDGLEPRENLVGGGALRWTRPGARFRFDSVGPGRVAIDLEIRDHRTEVNVIANGARVGTVNRGERRFTETVQLSGSSLELGLETEGFQASGRVLGTQLVSLRIEPERKPKWGMVPLRLALTFIAVILVAGVASALTSLSPFVILLPPAALLLMVLPAGLWRSGWLVECAVLIGVATVVSAAVSRSASGSDVSRACLQAALFMALTLHGLIPPSPLVVQGDAQLHGNKLMEVAKGNAFPTTRTDHKPPFEIPYGFSFYALLSPWSGQGSPNVSVVRHGAAFFSALSVMALAWFIGRSSAGLAAATVLLWATAPVNLRTMGYGNLSNVFAQAIFLLFLVGAGAIPRGVARAGVLTLLVILTATAHLSSFIVLLTLLAAAVLFSADRRGPAFKPLLAGILIAAGYYATFVPLVAAQAERLLGERGGSAGVFDPWRLPMQVGLGLGFPLMALLVLSIAVAAVRLTLPLSRSLLLTGVALAVMGLVSPVEVRYLLALSPLLAMLAAGVFRDEDFHGAHAQTLASLVDLPGLRRLGSPLVRIPVAVVLLVAAFVTGVLVLLEFMPITGV